MAGSRPGSAASSRPSSGARSRPGSAKKASPPSAKKSQDAAAAVDEEKMVMLMRHRLDFVTPDRKVRLQGTSAIDAGDDMINGGRKGSAAAAAVVRELEASAADAEAEIAEWAATVKAAVDARAAALIEELATVRDTKAERLKRQVATIEAMMDAFGKAIAKTREGIEMVDEGGKDTKLTAGVKKLGSLIKKSSETPVPLTPCETSIMRLATPVNALVDAIACEGVVAGLRARSLTVEPTQLPGSGCEMTISGTNFGDDTSLVEVWIGSIQCDLLDMWKVKGSQYGLRCVAPPGSGTGLAVNVRLCNEHGWSAEGTNVSYAAPLIEALDPPGGPIGTDVTIYGHHLGGAGAPPRVSIGGYACPNVEIVDDHSALRITIPDDLPTGTFSFLVERGSQASTAKGEEPPPCALFDVAVKMRFGFNTEERCNGGGLDFDLPDESEEGQGRNYTPQYQPPLDFQGCF